MGIETKKCITKTHTEIKLKKVNIAKNGKRKGYMVIIGTIHSYKKMRRVFDTEKTSFKNRRVSLLILHF